MPFRGAGQEAPWVRAEEHLIFTAECFYFSSSALLMLMGDEFDYETGGTDSSIGRVRGTFWISLQE